MQKITNIEIKNFKSIRHAEIKDCRKINVFIGYPNVGKSNVLEALSIFCVKLLERKNFTDFIRAGETPSIFFNGFISNDISITINNKFQANLNYEKDEAQLTFNLLDEEGINKSTLIEKIPFRERFKINGWSRPIGKEVIEWMDIRKYEFRKEEYKISSNFSRLIFPFGGNIFNVIQSNEKLVEEIIPLFKNNDLELLYDSGTQLFSIYKRTSKGIFTIPYSMIADTLQRLIFYKAAIVSNKDSVLLFEEPEAHMFPPYVKKFTSDVIFDETNQFFIATHSPFVLNEFIEEAQDDLSVYVVDYDNGETVIKRLTDEQVTEVAQYGIDLFFNLESYLDKYGQPHSA